VIRRLTWMVALTVLASSAAWAQEPRVELSATSGWTFSDGVGGANAVVVPGVGTFSQIDPKDAFSWGARLGFNVSPNVEVGFLFDQQKTKLEIGGTSTFDLGDMSVYNYHGYFAYNFGESDAKVRPYVLGGLGITQYGTVNVTVGNVQRDISGNSKFSTTWGAGVKLFPSPKFGVRLESRWTPTYIKSDATGYWCDPYWGCYVTGNAQYSNQFEFSGGVILRF
jgi:opacity protein-like surface antigen